MIDMPEFESIIDRKCEIAFKEMESYMSEGLTPEKFPEQCRSCWKVLVFDTPFAEALFIRKEYPHSKMVETDDDVFLVVIYTESENERDRVRSELNENAKVSGRVRYRFACKLFQEYFPEMFISMGKPNPDFL